MSTHPIRCSHRGAIRAVSGAPVTGTVPLAFSEPSIVRDAIAAAQTPPRRDTTMLATMARTVQSFGTSDPRPAARS